jgi:hypothetical protein
LETEQAKPEKTGHAPCHRLLAGETNVPQRFACTHESAVCRALLPRVAGSSHGQSSFGEFPSRYVSFATGAPSLTSAGGPRPALVCTLTLYGSMSRRAARVSSARVWVSGAPCRFVNQFQPLRSSPSPRRSQLRAARVGAGLRPFTWQPEEARPEPQRVEFSRHRCRTPTRSTISNRRQFR